MRKICLFCVFLTVLLFNVYSQDTIFGVKAGTNLGWFSGSNWDNYVKESEDTYGISVDEQVAINFHIGIFLEYMFSNNFGILSELSYTQYGQDYEYSALGYNIWGEFRQKTIEIPILLKFSRQAFSGIYGLVGPTILFLIDDFEFKESGGGIVVKGSNSPDNEIVIGGLLGIGSDYRIGNGVLKVEARYGRNITYAFDSKKDPFDVNGLQILLGYGVFI